ncbi:hypothetical protein H8E07_15160 [bacterium]|nr:hypothetical protein [bacterium]
MNQWSLKTRLTLMVGLFLVLMQGVVSLVVLVRERNLLKVEHAKSTLAAARSLTSPLLDALIEDEIHPGTGNTLLDQDVSHFMEDQAGQVRYVVVLDNQATVLAHSDRRAFGLDYRTLSPYRDRPDPVTSIYSSPDYGWVIEATLPLRIATKRWGTLLVGFDAEVIRTEINRLFVFLGLLSLGVTLLTIVVVYLITRRATRQLVQIVSAVDALDLDSIDKVTLPVCDGDAGILASHFEVMQRRLARSRNELKRAEREIHHAEKLASVGRLAAGVAHEINNPLMGIRNCVEGIAAEPSDAVQSERYLGLAREGLQRIGSIVRQLLEFSRKRPRQRVTVDLLACVNKMTDLLEFRLDKEEIGVHVTSTGGDTMIMGDPQQFEELCLNLMINACDAMPNGGRIVVHFSEPQAGWLTMSIADEGEGIAPDNLDRIFEPFFTTKEVGHGTGLGLSVTESIVENHGGDIKAATRPEGGAAFTVRLPRVDGGEPTI